MTKRPQTSRTLFMPPKQRLTPPKKPKRKYGFSTPPQEASAKMLGERLMADRSKPRK